MDKSDRPVYDWKVGPETIEGMEFSIWADSDPEPSIVLYRPIFDSYEDSVVLTRVESVDDLISRLTHAREWLAKAMSRVS